MYVVCHVYNALRLIGMLQVRFML